MPIEAVVSFGTGNPLEAQPVEGFGWAPIFNQLINSATNTEAVHDSLADFLPSDRYFRFNPCIESMGIDEVRAYMPRCVRMAGCAEALRWLPWHVHLLTHRFPFKQNHRCGRRSWRT